MYARKTVRRSIEGSAVVMKLGVAERGPMVELAPRTTRELKVFEPIMSPIMRSVLPFLAATIDVASSGRDVPIAISMNPMIAWLMPREDMMSVDEVMRYFAA